MYLLITVIFFLSLSSSLATLLLGIKQRFTLLWYYAATGFIFDIVMSILSYFFNIKVEGISNLFVIAEFLFISFFYKDYLYQNKRLFAFITSGLLSFFIIQTLLEPLTFNTFGASAFCLAFIIYGIMGFYTIIRSQQILFLGKSYFFWVNVAVLIYASGSFLLFLFRYYLQKEDDELFNILWRTFFRTLNTTRYLLIGVALFQKSKE